MFADDEIGNAYASRWKVSACRELHSPLGITHDKNGDSIGPKKVYNRIDMSPNSIKVKFNKTDLDIAPYKMLSAFDKHEK